MTEKACKKRINDAIKKLNSLELCKLHFSLEEDESWGANIVATLKKDPHQRFGAFEPGVIFDMYTSKENAYNELVRMIEFMLKGKELENPKAYHNMLG